MSLVQRSPAGHDRATGATDRAARPAVATSLPDPLESALQRLRLQGAIFLRAEYCEPWSYESLPGPATAAILRPGTDRLILFHLVAAGTCWVQVGDHEKHWASSGDVVVLPYGDQHRMGGVGESETVPLMEIMEAPPWARMPLIRHGRDGEQTDVVCGFLHSEDVLFDPELRVFPPAFVVRPDGDAGAAWVRANVDFALAQAEASPLGPDAVSTRLPEMLLVEVLRQHLATAPAADHGWLAALHDPVLNPALCALHAAPERKWTVIDLARVAAVSRSGLDERFRQVLGRSPIRYLTEWRMHLAEDLLTSTDLGVVAIAHRVGYDAEEAFSRAFKRLQRRFAGAVAGPAPAPATRNERPALRRSHHVTSPALSVLDLVPVRSNQTTGDALAATRSLARVADALGFRRYWLAEHHNMPAVAATNPPVLIAMVAAATERIRVGSGGG